MLWIINLVASAVGFLGIQLSKRTILIATVLAASGALLLALSIAVNNLLGSIVATFPVDLASGAAFLPSNTAACISAIIAAKTARFLYDVNVHNLQMAASIN